MNLIEPCVELVGITNYSGSELEVLRRIEQTARACYRSRMSEPDEFPRTISFLQGLYKKQHDSVFSHGQFTIGMGLNWTSISHQNLIVELVKTGLYRWFDYLIDEDKSYFYVSGSLRVWLSLMRYATNHSIAPEIQTILQAFYNAFPLLTKKPLVEVKHFVDIVLKDDTPPELYRYLFRIVTDRAVTMEADRHTTLGFSEESQRYCKYEKTGLRVIVPPELKECKEHYGLWEESVKKAEEIYKKLREKGIHQQVARSVLPNCTVVEFYTSGITPFIKHFITIRGSQAAHPHIRWIAEEMKRALCL